MSAEEIGSIRGTVARVTFRNPENGYSVIQIDVDDSNERITAVGICPQAKIGAHLLLRGNFIAHPRFGQQFTVNSFTETPPSTAEGINRYLASGLIDGVGQKTADRIVKAFGDRALEVVRTDPEAVAKLPGVGKKRAELLSAALAERSEFDQTLRFLVEHKISPNLAARIYERYKEKTVDTVTKDPYILAREIRGIGFLTADTIARNLGMAADAPERLRAGVLYALQSAMDDGHCYLSRDSAIDRAAKLLEVDDLNGLTNALDRLVELDLVVARGPARILKQIDLAEQAIANFVLQRTEVSTSLVGSREKVEAALAATEHDLGITLSDEQRRAVALAGSGKILIITGGPGCGKTTLIRALTALFDRSSVSYALAAPTGRAAQRMAAVCSRGASTIHRLLKFDPHKGKFVHGPETPLPFQAIIIDECSMVDVLLARDLFAAIGSETTIILVGDKDQLPSVGPGRVFADLIMTDVVPLVVLSRLFRRSEESRINVVAHEINNGDLPNIPSPDGSVKSDAYFIQRDDAAETAKLIESLVSDQIPRKFGFSDHDIAVLTPSNRGPAGTQELNRRLQEKLNPAEGRNESERITLDWGEFRLGDRVCQRVNNYKIDPAGVFNGDMGVISSIKAEIGGLVVDLWDGRQIEYQRNELHQLSLAYAFTVHRSQGMEVPCVVLVLDTSQFNLLERQLLYTAVTRARKLLIIVGSKRALAIASKRATHRQRGTTLRERISGGTVELVMDEGW